MGSSGTGAYENLLQIGLQESVAQQLDQLITDGYFPPEGYPPDVAGNFRGIDEPTLNEILNNYKQSDFTNVSDFGDLLLQVAKGVFEKGGSTNGAQPMVQQPPEYMKQEQMDNQNYPGPAALEHGYQGKPSGGPRSSGPTSERMQKILDRTGYKYEATAGQRSYGPGPGFEDFKPPKNCQCYYGKIPYELNVEDLVEMFEKAGTIFHMRLMMNPETGKNQTYGFVTFTEPQAAKACVEMYDGYDVLIPLTNRRRQMVVKISEPNRRLFVGPVPKSKTKDDIMEAFSQIVAGIEDVIIHEPAEPGNAAKNKGFCFLDFVDHKSACTAKKHLDRGDIPIQSWRGFTGYGTEWADPLDEPDEETMSKVTNLYITKLSENVTEEQLNEVFSQYGTLDKKIKKIQNYAFVHFADRDACMRALEEQNGKQVGDSFMKIALAKPVDPNKKNQMGGPGGRGDRRGGMGRGGFGGPRGRGGAPPGGFGRGGSGYGGEYGYAADSYGYDQYGYGPPSYGYGYDQSRGYGGGYGSADPYSYGFGGGYGGAGAYGAPSGYGAPPPSRGGGYGSPRGGGGGGFGGRGGFQGDKRSFGGRGGPPPKRGRGGF